METTIDSPRLTDVKEGPTEREVRAEPGGAPGVASLWGQHSAVVSIGLHLLPGVFTGAAFLVLSPLIIAAGYPPHVALVLAVPLALVPVSVGLLLYLGYQRNGHLSLDGLVLNREPVRIRQFLAYVPLVFLTSLVVFAILGSVLDGPLHDAAFAWMPSLDWGLGGGYGRSGLVFTFALAALFVVLLESTVEEVYFRGFLLPRMDYAGRWAVPLHTFLFALYHVWMPWRVVSLSLGMVPLVFAVRRTRNIYVAMVPHALLNAWDVAVGIAFIAAMTSG